MIGALASASGVSTAVSSIPMGGLSERYGRRLVMLLGFLCFILTPLIYTVSSNPIHLLISRIVLGLGMGSTFSIGFVYITELVIPEIRGVAKDCI